MCEVLNAAPVSVKAAILPILVESPFTSAIACCAELERRGGDLRLIAEIRQWAIENCQGCCVCNATAGPLHMS